uniref:Uncharacterized protein n=1 Tax=Rhizophora mucronata TaxID=61149 RepID=A0A2P2NRH4_RHIMU
MLTAYYYPFSDSFFFQSFTSSQVPLLVAF